MRNAWGYLLVVGLLLGQGYLEAEMPEWAQNKVREISGHPDAPLVVTEFIGPNGEILNVVIFDNTTTNPGPGKSYEPIHLFTADPPTFFNGGTTSVLRDRGPAIGAGISIAGTQNDCYAVYAASKDEINAYAAKKKGEPGRKEAEAYLTDVIKPEFRYLDASGKTLGKVHLLQGGQRRGLLQWFSLGVTGKHSDMWEMSLCSGGLIQRQGPHYPEGGHNYGEAYEAGIKHVFDNGYRLIVVGNNGAIIGNVGVAAQGTNLLYDNVSRPIALDASAEQLDWWSNSIQGRFNGIDKSYFSPNQRHVNGNPNDQEASLRASHMDVAQAKGWNLVFVPTLP